MPVLFGFFLLFVIVLVIKIVFKIKKHNREVRQDKYIKMKLKEDKEKQQQ